MLLAQGGCAGEPCVSLHSARERFLSDKPCGTTHLPRPGLPGQRQSAKNKRPQRAAIPSELTPRFGFCGVGTPGRHSSRAGNPEGMWAQPPAPSSLKLPVDLQKPAASWAQTPALALENAASTLAMLCLGLVFLAGTSFGGVTERQGFL